jgi:hypothetical protein
MVLAPQRASLGLTVTGQAVLGVTSISITDKVTMKEITCDADTSVRRFPTIKDADAKATIIDDPADAGMILIRASKAANPQTLLTYVATKGTKTYTFTAYVESISDAKGPSDERSVDISLSVSGGVTVA